MAFTYNTKLIISGKEAEVYLYKKTIWKEFKINKKYRDDPEPKQIDMFKQLQERKTRAGSSINRTRTKLRRLINTNYNLNKFLTLTFAENITDLKEGNYKFNQFIKRLKYKYPDIAYVAVFEFQKRGAIHYHLLCDLPFIDSQELSDIWRHGFIKIKKTNNINNIGAYMSKYLGKDMDQKTFGKKKFFKSQNLKDPVEIYGFRAKEFINEHLKDIEPTFHKIFNSKWTDDINYSSYTMKQPVDIYKKCMIE